VCASPALAHRREPVDEPGEKDRITGENAYFRVFSRIAAYVSLQNVHILIMKAHQTRISEQRLKTPFTINNGLLMRIAIECTTRFWEICRFSVEIRVFEGS
jgi:hypothetical protein